MQRKLRWISSNYVLPSYRILDILKIGVGTHNWMYVRKKDFHVSYTWYKSLIPTCRGATATKASKARALPRFWVTVNPISTRGQIMPTTVLWALSGSNSPWRPCIWKVDFCIKLNHWGRRHSIKSRDVTQFWVLLIKWKTPTTFQKDSFRRLQKDKFHKNADR